MRCPVLSVPPARSRPRRRSRERAEAADYRLRAAEVAALAELEAIEEAVRAGGTYTPEQLGRTLALLRELASTISRFPGWKR